ncbi:MAG TPA: Hsp70 family protein, partial [Candidatus Dormibacteraeota bacterium]
VFSTAADNQPSVEVVVLQGERPMARDNRTLGTFRLDGIPPAPRGTPQIDVAFDIDANGILTVSAKDRGTGKENRVTITGSTTLDKSEVDRMVREAEANAAEDRRRADAAEARNTADQLAYQAEKALTNAGDRVPADVRSDIERKVQAVRDALAGNDIEAMRRATLDLQSGISRIGEAVYAGAATGGPSGNGASGGGGGQGAGSTDDVVDAEFKEV